MGLEKPQWLEDAFRGRVVLQGSHSARSGQQFLQWEHSSPQGILRHCTVVLEWLKLVWFYNQERSFEKKFKAVWVSALLHAAPSAHICSLKSPVTNIKCVSENFADLASEISIQSKYPSVVCLFVFKARSLHIVLFSNLQSWKSVRSHLIHT